MQCPNYFWFNAGIGHEGIFRINGSSKVVEKLRMQYDRHGNANLEEAGDVMAVASLLKLFFRELPDPLIVGHLHAQFLTVQEEFQYNKDESLKQLKNLLQQLPEENFLVLRHLCSFLRKVIHHEDTNKMNSMALAIVFGPNLFRCAEGIQGLREQGQTNHLVRLFIEKFDFLFGHDVGNNSPPSPVAINGTCRVWNSKRIEVQAAKERKSPPITPIPLPREQYMKPRRMKLASQEEVDLNSNYSDVSKEDLSSGSPHHGYLSTPSDGDMDERALSPFNLDSEQGTSAAPSPISSSITSELVERTIQESISQHLFGIRGSPRLDLSPRQETPVAMPRKKHQKKNQDSSSFNRRSNSESSLEHLVNSFSEKEGLSVKSRVQQFSDDTLVSSKSHDQAHPVRRKGRPTSKAFDIFESQGIIIGQKPMDTSVSRGYPREDTLTDVTQDEGSELDSVKRNSGTLNSLTAGRASPPKRRSPTKKNIGTSGDQNPNSPTGRGKAAKRSNNSELRTQTQDVWLRQNGDGQRSPSNGARNPREGGLWGVHNPKDAPPHMEQPLPQPRPRRAKMREEDREEERWRNGALDGERRMMEDERRQDTEGRRMKERRGDGRRKEENMDEGIQRLKGEERETPSPNSLRGQVVPPLDLTSLHVNTDGHEAVLAWQGQQASSKGGGEGGGGEGEREMEEGSKTLSRLEKLQTITSLLQHEPYDAPLSPRAKDAPPTFGSGSWDILEGPPSPVSKHNMFPRSSKRSESSLDEDDQVAVIKRLTRQVRSLKQKIKQYEEDFERQYHAKPSHSEKLSQPEIRKMIGELKRATKQLKALKNEAKETKNPLHSTLPARISTNEMDEGGGGSPVHLSGLKEALNLAQKRLQEKRDDAKRCFDVLEMSQDEVREEKVAIQKALLQLESKYGRPTSRASKEVMKPLYDRYRTLKKLMKNKELRRSISEEGNPSDLNTIEEHVETREFIPKQLGPVHSKYDSLDQEDEALDEIFGTTDFRVTQMVSPSQRSSGRSPSEDMCESPNDSYRNDSPFSPASAAFHEASLEELQTRRDQAADEKRRLRRVLKDFEENFRHETGQRVQKEDRSPMEVEYGQYKHIKKQLKLLNALIAKHQSQTLAAVT